MLWILYKIFKVVLLITLPFILLIRGSVFLHTQYELYPWISLAGGAIATIILLALYFSFMYGKVTGKRGGKGAFKRRSAIAMFFVIGYCLHGLFVLNASNIKHKEIQSEYRSLHPILRMSVSTILFLDKSLIITDAQRAPEDYKKMGLKTKRRSLHYKQTDGFSHAIDIRTNGRTEIRNFLLKSYFSLMGFNTLRHGGTGDHLHISLKSFDSPGAI